MRLDDSTRIKQISLHTPKAQLLPRSVLRPKTAAVLGSHSRSTESSSVIDAEYVEIYTSENVHSFKPSGFEVAQSSGGQQQHISRQNLVGHYKKMAADTPMPGKYLDIFA